MDGVWWDVYAAEVRRVFRGELLAVTLNGHGARPARVHHYRNSGGGAVALAIARGAKRVVLLGYDMQHTGGRAHWHGDHPDRLGNAGKVGEWPAEFEALARDHPGVEIINCSRETALRCFPRMTLKEALC